MPYVMMNRESDCTVDKGQSKGKSPDRQRYVPKCVLWKGCGFQDNQDVGSEAATHSKSAQQLN